LLYKTPAKELEERKRFAAPHDVSKTRTPNIVPFISMMARIPST